MTFRNAFSSYRYLSYWALVSLLATLFVGGIFAYVSIDVFSRYLFENDPGYKNDKSLILIKILSDSNESNNYLLGRVLKSLSDTQMASIPNSDCEWYVLYYLSKKQYFNGVDALKGGESFELLSQILERSCKRRYVSNKMRGDIISEITVNSSKLKVDINRNTLAKITNIFVLLKRDGVFDSLGNTFESSNQYFSAIKDISAFLLREDPSSYCHTNIQKAFEWTSEDNKQVCF